VRAHRITCLLAALAAVAAALATTAGPARAAGYQVTDVWGEYGAAPGQLTSPKGVVVDADGFVYVVDYLNHTVIKFTSSGEVALVWGGLGSRPGRLDNPSRIAMGPDGTLYVTDAENQRIQRFTTDGRLLGWWGREGRGHGEFRHPRGIAVAADGRVYVTDEGNARVQVFTAGGRFLRAWGHEGSARGCFRHPKDVAVSPRGRVYVVEAGNHRVQVFTRTGRWLATWGARGTAPGRFDGPRGVAVDASGHVFVADAANCRVQEFRAGGSLVRVWGVGGVLPGLFDGPRDVAFAPDGSVVVADTRNHRLQRFVLSALDDDEAPKTGCDVASGWWREPVTATLLASDAGSGVAVTYARVGAVRPFQPYTAPIVFDGQGVWALQYVSVDAAGNQETVRRRTLRLDWTAPAVRALPALAGVSGSLVTLRCVIADNVSPSCRVSVRVTEDGALVRGFSVGWLPVTPGGRAQIVRFGSWLAPGDYVVRVTARDVAGNRDARATSLTVR
jgi:DNA-binding beta-propeller fold protein YncE